MEPLGFQLGSLLFSPCLPCLALLPHLYRTITDKKSPSFGSCAAQRVQFVGLAFFSAMAPKNNPFQIPEGWMLDTRVKRDGTGIKGFFCPATGQEFYTYDTLMRHISYAIPAQVSIYSPACRNALAVRHHLAKRRVPVDNKCAFCECEDETQEHLFFQCDFARAIWFASSLQLDIRQLKGGDFMACWMGLLALYETQARRDDVLQIMAFVLWRIWKCRNEVVFKGVAVQAGDAVSILLKQVAEFNDAHVVESMQGMPQNARDAPGVTITPTWTCPSPGSVKLNCDGAWATKTGQGGVGWVLWDGIGCFLCAGGTGDLRCVSALMVEAEAVREALIRCLELGYNKVVVESDSLSLINMLNQEISQDVEIEGILFDIFCMTQQLHKVEFLHTPRTCNQAAHLVAAHVFRFGGRHSWDLVCPDWLFNCLAKDVNCSIRF